MYNLKTYPLFIITLAALFRPDICQAENTPALKPYKVVPSHADGIYTAGETITWKVTAEANELSALSPAHYVIKYAGGKVVNEGDLDLSKGSSQISYKAMDPIAYLVEVTTKAAADTKGVKSYSAAVVEPDKIKPAFPRPADFDAFWAGKMDKLRAIAPNPVVTREDSGVPGIIYETVVMENLDGSHVHAQIAYPESGGKFPAIIILQAAGVYAIGKGNVTGPAKEGWLAVNVFAHDLPFGQPESFYTNAGNTKLKNYAYIGRDDRDTSYFVKMFLGNVRVADYVTTLPQWDGKSLVAKGGSQGGLQAIALTGLHQGITALMVKEPAGCEVTGNLAGRGNTWPGWISESGSATQIATWSKVAPYFDAVNFAKNVKVPALVGIGLIDTCAIPSGIFAMVNQLSGPKEVVIMPDVDHGGNGHSKPIFIRIDQWLAKIRNTGNPLGKP